MKRILSLLFFLSLAVPAYGQFSLSEQQRLRTIVSQWLANGEVLGGVSTFDQVGSGTNTTGAFTLGSGSSLTVSGTGTNRANRTICTGNDYLKADGTCAAAGGTPNFDAVGPGTNASALVVGTGGSLGVSGTGTIAATSAPFSGLTAGTNSTSALVVGTGASLAVSGSGTIAATTAVALASNPTDCATGAYAKTIAASGNLTCDILLVSSASAPTVNDDSGDGYIIGTKWITTAGLLYQATDVTVGAAIWKPLITTGTPNIIDVSGNTITQPQAYIHGSKDYCADAGSTDAYACSVTPAPTALTVGMRKRFKANTANTTAASFNLNSLGAVVIKKVLNGALVDLETGDIAVNSVVEVVYDTNGNWQMQSPPGKSAAAGVTGTLSTTNCLTRELTSGSVECSSLVDDGAGTITFGTVAADYHEFAFAAPTGAITHTFPAVDGDVAQTTGAKTLDHFARFNADGVLVQSGATTITTAQVIAALKTKSIWIPVGDRVTGSALTDAHDYPTVWRNNIGAMTVTEVWCQSDAGSPTVMLQRDDGTPANMLTGNLTVSTSGATGTVVSNGEQNLAVGNIIGFQTIVAGGVAKEINCEVKATLD